MTDISDANSTSENTLRLQKAGRAHKEKGKEWSNAIKRALARRGKGNYRRGLDLLANRMVAAALDLDDVERACYIIERIGDRIQGKAAQSLPDADDVDNLAALVARVQLIAATSVVSTQHLAVIEHDASQQTEIVEQSKG